MTICRYWVGLTLSLFLSSLAHGTESLSVNQADNLVAQWVSIEKQNAQLKDQWQETERLLRQRLALLKLEKKQLQRLTADNTEQVDSVSQARQELLTLQTSMESSQNQLSSWLNNEFSHIHNLLPQLPPPLASSWQLVLDELSTDDVSARLESLLSLYHKYHEFNQRVSTQQATITDAQGQQRLVKQLFLGTARGWYLSLDGSAAVAGQPQPSGWQWQHHNPIDAAPLTAAFAMLAHQQEAAFVTLPMSLATSTAQEQ